MKPYLYTTLVLYLLSFITVVIHHRTGGRSFRVLSTIALVGGLILHSIALGIRIYSTGHAPMASMYETLVFYSWTTVLVSLIVVLRYSERLTETITVPVASVALVFALANESEGGPLSLILRTKWFETHVTTSFVAYALFTLAFSGAVLYLVYEKGEDRELQRKFQDITSRSILWGFSFFSVSMFAGAVWAYLAWGMYWLWEPKVIWSFIVWFYYAGAMHAYYVREWRGKGLAIATVIGFFVVLFTYLGVGLLMKSSHTF